MDLNLTFTHTIPLRAHLLNLVDYRYVDNRCSAINTSKCC